MSKMFIKNIAVASFITLNIFCGAAWGMWDELDTDTQRCILKAHIEDITDIPGLNAREQNSRRAQKVHTGGWLENYPEITIETTCAVCKREITTAYTTVVIPQRLAIQNATQVLLQQQNDLLRQQIALLSHTPTPQ